MMEGITNIAKTILATQDEEVGLELIFYRDVSTKMKLVQRYEMMKEGVHFGSGPLLLPVQEPASSWGNSAY